ncbi:E3 ubiquitin-protein ligase DTX3L [Pelomyxa schiedti]|nr:E3 ubiquitin-protein ligase DTX3L [Pelomyxa schiedti]
MIEDHVNACLVESEPKPKPTPVTTTRPVTPPPLSTTRPKTPPSATTTRPVTPPFSVVTTTTTVASEPCPSCGKVFGIEELFAHVPTCRPPVSTPIKTPAKRPVVEDDFDSCPFCYQSIPHSTFQEHTDHCPSKPSDHDSLGTMTLDLITLREMLPHLDDALLKETLVSSGGNVEQAVAVLLGVSRPTNLFPEDAPPTPITGEDVHPDMRRLMHIFPKTELSALKTAMDESHGDLNVAVALLMGETAMPPENVSGPDAPYDPSAVAKPVTGKSVVVTKNGVVFRINKTAPCQSYIGLSGDPADLLTATLPAKDAQFCAYCFSSMLEREQQYFSDYFVFYHSYSLASLLYELNSEIAAVLYGLPTDFPPLPRLLQAAFDEKPTMGLLMKDFKSMVGNDHDPRFRALVISVSNGLFASASEMQPLSCFMQGYSCGDVQWLTLLTDLLKACGFSGHELEDVIQRAVDIGAKYNLPTSHYKSASYVGFSPTGSEDHPPGNMLQIFIHKDAVNSVSYPCQPYGHPIHHIGSVQSYLRRTTNGQARVFCHPALFVDRKQALIFHYCANQDLCCTDSSIPYTRGALKRELRNLLRPVLGTPEGRRAAFQRIQGHKPFTVGGDGVVVDGGDDGGDPTAPLPLPTFTTPSRPGCIIS